MNVLILTPDAVGSTLLQRMLTIYMQFHDFGRPVINMHELTNGLAKYYSPEFGREIVSKKTVQQWGYHQTLQQVTELLGSVDHYKTSRLAHYHISRRGDTMEQQVPFYHYLNENFYVIACRRTNVFEHALSMTLNTITKKLNVYDAYEKIDTFYEIYKSGVTLDPRVFKRQLDAYKLYVKWSEQHFDIASYFNYEQDIPRLEQYILDLPVFSAQTNRVTWNQNFGISFNDWNKMHYARSDLNHLSLAKPSDLNKLIMEQTDVVKHYQQHAPEHWPAVHSLDDVAGLPLEIQQQWAQSLISHEGVVSLMSQPQQQALAQFKHGYNQAQQTITQMIDLGIIINGPPIKKQTLSEKQKTIRNFEQLIEIYNNWALANPETASPLSDQDLSNKTHTESEFWNSIFNSTGSLPGLLPNQR
jgi:hypothetical protein